MKTDIIKTLPGSAEYKYFEQAGDLPYINDPNKNLTRNKPAETLLEGAYVIMVDNQPLGRFAFYCNESFKYNIKKACCIGSYECVNDFNVSELLLSQAKKLAKEKGYEWIIGPMDGATWNNYRFNDHNDEKHFFLESYHPSYYNDQFKNAGFEVISRYISNKDHDMSFDLGKLDKQKEDYAREGAVFRNLDLDNLEHDLTKLAEFSNDAFSDNFLFTPIESKVFVDKYKAILNYIDPRLVLIAEDKLGIIQAFSFSIQDYYDPTGKTLIFKSMARRRNSKFAGMGSYLAGRTLEIGRNIGYETIVHAFVLQGNKASTTVSKYYEGTTFKSYSLYGLKV